MGNIKSLMAKDGVVYIKVYERDKSGVGCKTTKGWQRNMKLISYTPYFETVFGDEYVYERKGDLLIVRRDRRI